MKPRLLTLSGLLACQSPAKKDTAATPLLLVLSGLLACDPPADDVALVQHLEVAPVEDFAPLLRVSWEQAEPGVASLRYRVDGGAWQEAPPRHRSAGSARHHIIGHTFDQEVELSLIVETDAEIWESDTITIQAPSAPEALPLPTLDVNDPTGWDPTAPYLLNSTHEDASDWSGVWWVFIIDREGRPVWTYRSEDTSSYLGWVSRHVSLNADKDAILIDQATAWTRFDDGEASTVIEMTLDGTTTHTYITPGLHHPYTTLPDGALAWGARTGQGYSEEIIQIVERDGSQRELWRCGEDCGSNTLWWDEDTDHLLYSFWSSESIAEIDIQSGTLVRRLGRGADAWGFAQSQDAFWWQHGPIYTDTGTLLVSTHTGPNDDETVVREYELDEETQQLVEIWSAGEGRGHIGEYGGDAWRLPGGNTLHGNGSGGWLTEYLPSGAVAWEAHWPDGHRIGQTSQIADLYDFIP